MGEFGWILDIIQTSFDIIVKGSFIDEANEKTIDLKYISSSYNAFDNRLFRTYGIKKQDLIKHIAFEIYCEIIQQNIRLKQKSNSLEGLLKKCLGDKDIEKNRIKNYRNKKAIPYLNKYKYLFYDNMLESKIESIDFFWKRVSLHRELFFNNNISDNFKIVSNKDRYNVLDFQSYFYSYVICNYTEKSKVIGKMTNANFSKINLSEYVSFIKGIYKMVKEKEEYKTISYYMIEKEFSPILVAKMFSLKKTNTIDGRIIRNGWYTTMHPIVFHKANVMDKIIKQNKYLEKDTLANKYKRYPLGVEIGLLRMYKEFLPSLYLFSYMNIQTKYKEGIYKVIESNKEKFESIYANLDEELENSIRVLEAEADNKKSQEIFKCIMSGKDEVYTEVKTIIEGISVYNEKIEEYQVSNNKNVLLESVYIKEDNKFIVDNNILLKIISGYAGTL